MNLVWRCECGEDFPEPGDRSGFGRAFRHMLDTKHKIMGLVDADTGDLLVKGLSLRNAQKAGYVRRKAEDEKTQAEQGIPVVEQSKSKPKGIPGAYLTVKPLVAEVSPELLPLYNLAKEIFPADYGDATLSEWVNDVIAGYYADNAEVFDLGRLLRKKRPEFAAIAAEEEGAQ